jgi:hypothetical protein
LGTGLGEGLGVGVGVGLAATLGKLTAFAVFNARQPAASAATNGTATSAPVHDRPSRPT